MFDDTFNNLSVIRHDNYFFVHYSKELNTFGHVLSSTETILISYTPLSIYVFGGCIYYYFNVSFVFRRLVCLCCLPLWIVLFCIVPSVFSNVYYCICLIQTEISNLVHTDKSLSGL